MRKNGYIITCDYYSGAMLFSNVTVEIWIDESPRFGYRDVLDEKVEKAVRIAWHDDTAEIKIKCFKMIFPLGSANVEDCK